MQKTFAGAIMLAKTKGSFEPAKQKGTAGQEQKEPLAEIIEKINQRYKGQFTAGDRVLLTALHSKLLSNKKLRNMAKSSDPQIFTESIFPAVFNNVAMESYVESQDTYTALFEDKNKYNSVMSALAEILYREMRA